jgi:hypothetical protein
LTGSNFGYPILKVKPEYGRKRIIRGLKYIISETLLTLTGKIERI